MVLRAGQTLSVAVAALEDNAALEVFAPGGGGGGGGGGAAAAASRPRDAVPEPPPGAAGLPLTHPGAADLKLWSGRVPVTGPYLIAVCPTRGNAAYELELDCG